MLQASKGTALSVHCPTFQFFSNSMYGTCFRVFFCPREGEWVVVVVPSHNVPPPTMHAPQNYKILGSHPGSRHHTPPKTTHAAPGPRTPPEPYMPPTPRGRTGGVHPTGMLSCYRPQTKFGAR